MPKSFKILVADDEIGLLELMRRRVQRLGHSSDEARDGQTAAALIEKTKYDVIVTDITMPGHTGLELLEMAKARDPHVQVIIITADATMETAIQALNHGAFSYLAKPFPHLTVFDQTILRALEFRRLLMESQQMAAVQRMRGDLLEDEVQERLMQVRRVDRESRQILAHIHEGILVQVRGRTLPSNAQGERWLAEDSESPDRPLSAFLGALANGTGDRADVFRLNHTTVEARAVELVPEGASGHVVIVRDLSEPARTLARRLAPAIEAIRRNLDSAGDAWSPDEAMVRLEKLEAALRSPRRSAVKHRPSAPPPAKPELA